MACWLSTVLRELAGSRKITSEPSIIKCFVKLDRVGLCEARRRLVVKIRPGVRSRPEQQLLACATSWCGPWYGCHLSDGGIVTLQTLVKGGRRVSNTATHQVLRTYVLRRPFPLVCAPLRLYRTRCRRDAYVLCSRRLYPPCCLTELQFAPHVQLSVGSSEEQPELYSQPRSGRAFRSSASM